MTNQQNKQSIGELYPHLIEEFDPKRNKGLNLFDLTPGSSKRILWTCKHNDKHVWEADANKRTLLKRGCPFCSGRRVTKEESVGTLFPHLLDEWSQENEGSLFSLSKGSDKRFSWTCQSCDHTWTATVKSRTKGTGCPKCSRKNRGKTISQALKNKNGVLASNHPHLKKEWHPVKNNDLTPYHIASGTNRKVWWICEKGHEWRATVNSRALRNVGCPECKKEWKTSFPEQALFYYLTRATKRVENRFYVTTDDEKVEADIYLDDFKIVIEYDGYHHINRTKQDEQKNTFFQNKALTVIRIREQSLPTINGNHYTIKRSSSSYKDLDDTIRKTFSLIKTLTDHSLHLENTQINTKKDQMTILNAYIQDEKQRSLSHTHPEIAEEWHPTKNGTLSPLHVKAGSSRNVWWLGKCEHEWDMPIGNRTKKKPYRCPICSGNRVHDSNSLLTCYPVVANEWSDKNKLSANDVLPGTHKHYWWTCQTCQYEWKASPNTRTKNGSGCPLCGRVKSVTSRIQNKIKKEGSLLDHFPDICKEWHPDNKKEPFTYSPYSSQKVWWKGSCGHKWRATVSSRTSSGYGCPTCGHQKKGKTKIKNRLQNGDSLFAKNPILSKEWDNEKNKPLSPKDVTPNTNKKVWWVCNKNNKHNWQSRIADRNRGSGCPFCSGRKVLPEDSVSQLIPQLMPLWHHEKNNIKPEETPVNKRVWWLCTCGHVLKGSAADRINKKGFIRKCQKC